MAGSKLVRPGVWARVEAYVRMLLHPGTPWTVKAALLGAIVYLLSPFDLLPDWFTGLGLIDDLTVVSLLVALAIRLAEKDRGRKQEERG